MSLVELERVVALQLDKSSVNTLESLKAQNHIYGCFIVMEDLCNDTKLNLVDIEHHFSSIGIRHGFVMDTSLLLNSLPEYKLTWLAYFKELQQSRDIAFVDQTEDTLIDVVRRHVKEEHSFLMKAIESGVLPQGTVADIVEMLLAGLTDFVGKQEDKKEVNNEVVNEVVNEVKNEVKNEVVNEVKNEVMNEVKNEVVNEVVNEDKNKVKNEVVNEVVNEDKNDVPSISWVKAPLKKTRFARTRHALHITVPTKKYLAKTRRVVKK